MAFLRCLCLILTLWMVGSSPGAAVRPRSLSSSWWSSQASLPIQQAARRYRAAGDFAAAEKLYQQGYEEAQRHDIYAQVKYLTSIAGCRMALFEYRSALKALLEARRLAARIGDREDLGAIAGNLSSLYLQMWDVGAAMEAAEEGRAVMDSLRQPYFKPLLLLQLGRLHAILADDSAVALLEEGIEAAREQGDIATEARGWDLLGEEHLGRRRVPEAQRALSEAFRLRALHYPADLGFSYGRLADLKLAQGELETAARFNRRALTAATRGGLAWPEHLLRHQSGQIRLEQGQVEAALSDFSSALDLTDRWRMTVLPATSSLTATNAGLEQQVFRSFIEVAAGQALKTGSARRAAESWEAVEMNRVASLRESLALAEVWRKKLPAEYWEALGMLSAEDARLLRAGARTSMEAGRLRLKLTEMEAEAGVAFPVKKGENIRTQTSLSVFQTVLQDSEVLLSFHLGRSESYLWAVTRKTLRLSRLAPAERIRRAVEEFRDAVRQGRPEVGRLGEQLYGQLFGQLTPEESNKPSWLLSLEDSLFELPFAALVAERKGGKVVYVVERHSLQVVPGALPLSRNSGSKRPSGGFLGVGDPIYNVADPRWRTASTAPRRGPGMFELFAQAHPIAADAGELARLVASADEVEASALSWRAGSGATALLEGPDARRSKFVSSLSPPPAVIHLATHVLTPPGRQDQAFLAFGLSPSAGMEFLSTSDVARLHVPGSLVVMTGCATGSGDAQAGAGLLGLTRAWLMAGAGGVVATGWPVKDSSGELFSRFYNHLQGSSAAGALRQTQVDMIHSGTWRAAPSYWAAYQVTGGAR
jgi:CHAT domain-containing protein